MKRLVIFFSFFAFCLVFALGGCSRRPQSTADVPRALSASHKVAVAPFFQPLVNSQLFTGQLPIPQGKIPEDELAVLNRDLRDILLGSGRRTFDFLTVSPTRIFGGIVSSQPEAFERWLAYGEKNNLDYLLVPQVLDWHEREGAEMGVTNSASVRLEFFLLNIPQKALAGRSIYEEKQIGLIDNMLTMGDFIKRKGQWVTANTLAKEGMAQAVKDLGL